jgi:hypothetical protein
MFKFTNYNSRNPGRRDLGPSPTRRTEPLRPLADADRLGSSGPSRTQDPAAGPPGSDLRHPALARRAAAGAPGAPAHQGKSAQLERRWTNKPFPRPGIVGANRTGPVSPNFIVAPCQWAGGVHRRKFVGLSPAIMIRIPPGPTHGYSESPASLSEVIRGKLAAGGGGSRDRDSSLSLTRRSTVTLTRTVP